MSGPPVDAELPEMMVLSSVAAPYTRATPPPTPAALLLVIVLLRIVNGFEYDHIPPPSPPAVLLEIVQLMMVDGTLDVSANPPTFKVDELPETVHAVRDKLDAATIPPPE